MEVAARARKSGGTAGKENCRDAALENKNVNSFHLSLGCKDNSACWHTLVAELTVVPTDNRESDEWDSD